MTIYVSSSFAMKMLTATDIGCATYITSKTLEEVEDLVEAAVERGETVISAVRNQDIAAVLSEMSRLKLTFNLQTFKLVKGDVLFYANYLGPRIPRHATQLPPGGHVEWYQISVL